MIKDDIQKNIIDSLKSGDTTSVKVLRFVLSQIQYEEIAKHNKLSDEEAIIVIQKEVKRRKEAIEMFRKGGRQDLVDDEEKQLTILDKFLPQQLSQDELETIVGQILAENQGEKNTGKIIGLVIKSVKGRANGKDVAEIVKKKMNITA